MAIRITDDCINCGLCEPVCPNNAIYEPDTDWRWSDGTSLTDSTPQEPRSSDVFYIVEEKCTECVGFYGRPQCAEVCPSDCCVSGTHETDLLTKKNRLHGNN